MSDLPRLEDAVSECVERISDEPGDESPDLTVAFVSGHHAASYEKVPELVRGLLGETALIGCSSGGVIGAGREVEHRAGFAMCTATLPDVTLIGFHIETDAIPDLDAPPLMWEELVKASPESGPHFLLLTDPISFDAESLLMGLDYAYPESVKIGGLASGAGQHGGGNALYLGGQTYSKGAVGMALAGAIAIDTIVAQGCRPIGKPMHITSSDSNILLGLDGATPIDVLREMVPALPERDRELVQNSLHLGVVMDELNDSPQHGDYLIRNIMGADQRSGALAIGEMLKEGQTVQFHLRDAETSEQDLDALLSKYSRENPIYQETGALLFSCLGRGSYLYGRPDHDTDMFRDKVGSMPLTGFFCNGEIGPVAGTTFLHGFTSSFGIFRPKID